MSDGTHGHGSKLQVVNLTNVTQATNLTHWTTIANIITITGADQTKDPIDISTMDSTSKFREFIGGMLDAGEATCELNYDGSATGTANDLHTLYVSTNTDLRWQITFPDTSSWSSIGFVTALGHAVPFDDKISQSLTVKMTGVPTYLDV